MKHSDGFWWHLLGWIAIIVFLGILTTSRACADDDSVPLAAGEIGASYLANTGNTTNATLGVWGELTLQPGLYKGIARGGFVHATADDVVSSRRVSGSLRGERKLPNHLSMDVRTEYHRDPPAGTRNQFAVSGGVLWHILEGKERSIALSVSLTRTWEERMIAPDRDFLGSQSGIELHYAMNDLVQLDHDTAYVRDFSDRSNWRVKSLTTVQAGLNRHLAIQISYQLYRNKPDPGKRSIDTSMLGSFVVRWPAPKQIS